MSKKTPTAGMRVRLRNFAPYSEINFNDVENLTLKFAKHIESNLKSIENILLEYESFEVVQDEIERTLDHLKSLRENSGFFRLRVGEVAAFLPRNQPLYAFTCFVVIPSLMASEVHFRIPQSMRHFLPQLLKTLKVTHFFPNIKVSKQDRTEFLRERTALLTDNHTKEVRPMTDAVIFTGTPTHAEKLRLLFDKRTLFITNGSGHNPLVIGTGANIKKAVEATLSLQLYNQGQDCANPNAILVHQRNYNAFLKRLRRELKKVRVGQYRNRKNRVGPISDPGDLPRIQELLVSEQKWLDPSTPGIIRTAETIVEPTIICKPLNSGGNFIEVFSPVIFVQKYNQDKDLKKYFEDPNYSRNAMYVSLYGKSRYVENLIGKIIGGKMLHDQSTFLRDTHLHAPGKERGTQPYGGYGYGASSLSIDGRVICKPTLPQRDIFEFIARPLLEQGAYKSMQFNKVNATPFHKDVTKLLSLKNQEKKELTLDKIGQNYIDSYGLELTKGKRYFELDNEKMFTLINTPNVELIAKMTPEELSQVKKTHDFLSENKEVNSDDLKIFLYQVAKSPDLDDETNKKMQLRFFKNIYHLLLGKDIGPRLNQFLIDINREHALKLLAV